MSQTQHAPAVKVGGRRLSLTARHKPHVDTSLNGPAPARAVDDSAVDYPRPTRAPDEQEHHHDHEEVPKKEKKKDHNAHETDKREFIQHKLETTRPTKEAHPDHRAYGAGGRIAQPGNKMTV